MRRSRLTWIALHVALVALAVSAATLSLLKQQIGGPTALAACLAGLYAVVLLLRRAARARGAAVRGRLAAAWAGLDAGGLALLAFFLLLALFQYVSYARATADGREYFVQVRSLVVDRDLDLAADAATFRALQPHIFPFGSAVLWAPFVAAAHLWFAVLNLFGAGIPRNGYANPYQMAVGLATLLYGCAGLALIYDLLRDWFDRAISALSVVVVTAGSFIVWYLAVESSYTHGNSLFTTTLFVWLWHRSRAGRSTRQWALLGLAGGLMAMVRWQNAVFLLLPALEAAPGYLRSVHDLVRRRRIRDRRPEAIASDRHPSGPGREVQAQRTGGRGQADDTHGQPQATGPSDQRRPERGHGEKRGLLELLREHAVFGLGLLAGFFPQMLFWKVVNGGWLALPHDQTGQLWWGDALFEEVLFSANHGVLAWHPVLFVAVLGIPLFLRRDVFLGLSLTAAFLLQAYVNGAVAMWWGGHAFGGRRFASCALLFALGLAALLVWLRRHPMVPVVALLAAILVGHGFFLLDIRDGALPTSEGITFDSMLESAYRRLGNPFSFPANLWYAWRFGGSAWQYDQLGRQLYNNLHIDVGGGNDARFLARGWSTPEEGAAGTFRWAVTQESVVVAPLRAPMLLQPGEPQVQADYVLELTAEPFDFPGAPIQTLVIEVNGAHLTTEKMLPGRNDYRFDIPGRLLRRNLNVIRFRYGYARSPRELGLSDDPRRLAVMFTEIHLLRR